MELDADVTPVGVDPGIARLPGHVKTLVAEVRRLSGLLEPAARVRRLESVLRSNKGLRATLELIAAEVDSWEDGDVAPVDALVSICDLVRGAPAGAGGVPGSP